MVWGAVSVIQVQYQTLQHGTHTAERSPRIVLFAGETVGIICVQLCTRAARAMHLSQLTLSIRGGVTCYSGSLAGQRQLAHGDVHSL